MPCPCQLCPATGATVHLTELAPDGSRSELHLCRACVARLGVTLDHPPSISELLAGKQDGGDGAGDADSEAYSDAAAGDEAVAVPAPAPGHGACPQCGLEFSAYAQNNLFGCSECYQAFAPQVLELVKRYHGGMQHAGRLPAGGSSLPTAAKRVAARHALHIALQEAVANEQYERAAHLRDQLRELEG